MAIDDTAISGPDSAKEGMEYALLRAGLTTDPEQIIGRLFRFWAFPREEPVTILVGRVTGIVVFGDSITLEISVTKINMDTFVFGIEWSDNSWRLIIDDENGGGNTPGRFELL